MRRDMRLSKQVSASPFIPRTPLGASARALGVDRAGASDSHPRVPPPLVQLERSHRRLEEACEALSIAARDHDIETASDVCAFFARQVRRHEEDEERSLFPRLVDAGASPELRALLERLAREHREHEAVHARLEEAVSGRFEGDLWQELTAIAELMTRAYQAHVAREEAHVFPAAEALLGSDAIDAIAREMDARRGR